MLVANGLDCCDPFVNRQAEEGASCCTSFQLGNDLSSNISGNSNSYVVAGNVYATTAAAAVASKNSHLLPGCHNGRQQR